MSRRSKRGGTLYAIGIAGTSLTKIGYTTGDIDGRLAAFQTGHHATLELIAAVEVPHWPFTMDLR